MPRYQEEVYSRPRDAGRREEKDVRRTAEPPRGERRGEGPYATRMDETMDTRMDSRLDSRTDTRMDSRMDSRMDPHMETMNTSRMDSRMGTKPEPRANTGRPIHTEGVYYRDVETNKLYQEPPQGVRRTPHQEDFDDLVPRERPIINNTMSSGGADEYNEYFVPGEGIDREVIQREICRYLGPDALCRPGKGPDGRQGYLVRAYRALTSAMIKSLQESSSRLYAERDKRKRLGRSGEVTYSDIQDNRDFGFYENSMQNPMQVDMDMDMDDRYASGMNTGRPTRDMDPRLDPRMAPRMSGMAGMPPVSNANAYMQDPTYPAYAVAPGPPPSHGMQFEPRTYPSGNTPPPPPGMTMRGTAAYQQSGYPPRVTQASMATMAVPTGYRDPNLDRMRDYPYPQDRTRR